ncbi:sialate O-acetylesterase [Mesoflavibacter sp. CH_XMU1404-2]|uniref:sialate O-acetylesterase n=1 Tax=Mesoflavibacter sp. CH_XMU1404-2 TaxID=3107766 RepID=UPI00300AB1EE
MGVVLYNPSLNANNNTAQVNKLKVQQMLTTSPDNVEPGYVSLQYADAELEADQYITNLVFNTDFSQYLNEFKDVAGSNSFVVKITNLTKETTLLGTVTNIANTEVKITIATDDEKSFTTQEIDVEDELIIELDFIDKDDYLYAGFSGQSNMNCIVEGQTGGGDDTIDDDIQAWDDIQNIWVTADLTKYPFGERVSVGGADISGNNNLAFHTAKRLKERTGKKIRILFKAYSGISIDRWLLSSETHAAWDGLLNVINSSGTKKLDVFYFFQGETDSNNAVDLPTIYAGKIKEFINQIRSLEVSKKEIPFIAAELDSQYRLNDVFYRFPQYLKYIEDKNFTVIKTEDLQRLDTIHLTGPSIVTASSRYADAFLSLPVQVDKIFDFNYKTLTNNGEFIDPNINYVELDVSTASKNFSLPYLNTYKKVTIKIIGTSNLNFARINTKTGEFYNDGTTNKIDLYGVGTEITVVSTPEGHKIVKEKINNIHTREITGTSSVTNITLTKYSSKHIIVRGSTDTANVNITLPQHLKGDDIYIEREPGTTHSVNIINASGAEIDNSGSNFTINDGDLMRFYYSEEVQLYRWQTIRT